LAQLEPVVCSLGRHFSWNRWVFRPSGAICPTKKSSAAVHSQRRSQHRSVRQPIP